MSLYAYDVFNFLDTTNTPSLLKQYLKLVDSESIDTLRLKDINNNEDIPHVVVPINYKLVVGLHGKNWILDAQKSDIAQSDTSNIVLQELHESQGTNIFVFARNSTGENTLVFSRSDNETADEFSYFLSSTWVDTNTSIDDTPMAAFHDTRVLLRDSYATVMIVSEDNFDEETAYLFSSDTSENMRSEVPVNTTRTILPKNNDDVIMTKTQNNTEAFSRSDSVSEKNISENKPIHTEAQTTTDIYTLSLQEINNLLKIGNYEAAQNVITNYKNTLNSQKNVPHLLFDSAQYLEKMHEREGIQSIQNIEKAIMFYDRIVNEYPLSIVYDEALARREFLQKKYVYIR